MFAASLTHHNTHKTGFDKLPFNYSYAYPRVFNAKHQQTIEALYRYGLMDSLQLMRLTGWPRQSAARILDQLEYQNFICKFAKQNWAQIEGVRRAYVWGLLPRAAWRLSLQLRKPYDQFKTYQSVSMPATVEHSIDLTDIRLSFDLHAEEAGIEAVSWKTEREWRVGEALQIPGLGRAKALEIRPDGSALLVDRKGHKSYVFIEADRTNRNNWKDKIKAYKTYWSSGAFLHQYHINDTTTGFRVLVTTKSQHRADYLKMQTETVGQPEYAGLFLFAPIAAVATTANVYTAPLWGRGGQADLQSLYQPKTPETIIYEADDSPVFGIADLPQSFLPWPQVQLALEAL